MRLSTLYQVLRRFLLVVLLLTTFWSPTTCNNEKTPPCLDQPPRFRKQSDNFSIRAQVQTAQSRAYQSPVVFLGTLRSVLVQRDGTIRAWFAVDSPLKMPRKKETTSRDTEVVYYRVGEGVCLLELNQDNLKLGSQYLVFGAEERPSMAATALPIPNEKRTLRAVRRLLCKGCAKPPSIAGLKKVRVVEGEKAQLHCHLSGYPIPWVEWYKDGMKITATRGRVRVRTKRRTSRLVIRRARQSDRGVYECRAGNVVQKDTVSAAATLRVRRRRRQKTTSATTPPTPTITSTESSPWTTEPCPSSDFCLNGGTCIFYKDVREYVCHCAEGYVGLRCHYKDVRVSLGEIKNSDRSQDRLLITIVVLFLILFCFNWISLGLCWLCCFRSQQNNWGKFREMAPLRNFLRIAKKLSVDGSPMQGYEERPIKCDHANGNDETSDDEEEETNRRVQEENETISE